MTAPGTRCFVYGTLVDPDRAAAVLDEFDYRGDAVLDGCHRAEGEYPTLAPGGRAEGRLLVTPEIGALDAYEDTDRGLYVRVTVPAWDGGTAEVYVGDPDRLSAPAAWPGEGPLARRVRAYVDGHDVRIRPGYTAGQNR